VSQPSLAAALASAIVALLMAGCSASKEERPPPMVVTATATPAETGAMVLAGDVRARADAPLAFRLGGQIAERLVVRGQAVRRGQVLARLDVADLMLASAEARAQADAADRTAAAAEANAKRAAADAARLETLAGSGGIAPQVLDAARAAAAAGAAELAAARERAVAARSAAGRAGNQQRYASLVADADGVIADILADQGQVVAAGQPVMRLARAGPRDAVVAIPEALRNDLPRQADAILVGDGRRFAATLREVSGAADPVTRSFEARYALAGAEAIPPGRSVRLEVAATARANAVSVPVGALVDRGQGSAVWIVAADGTVRQRMVRVAAIADDMAVVNEGLAAGERVVALGAHLLTNGQAVRIGTLPR